MAVVETGGDWLERVLRSRTFAASPSSRRLLKYLAERSSGDDPELKEYAVGVDVFGKAEGYDPQRDSTVRIQVGRLRQKLSEYYEREGRSDAVVLEVPKGSYRVNLVPGAKVENAPVVTAENGWRWRWVALAAVVVVASIGYVAWRERAKADGWNGALEEIWGPLLAGDRPVLIAFSAPLFVELGGTLLFRERGEEVWEKAIASANLAAVSEALGGPAARASHYYAAAGEVGGAFALAKALSPRKANISVVRDVQLSWQQLADNHVIFLGAPRFFRDKLRDLPMELEILAERDSFRVLHPRAGEPAHFPKNGVQGDGETYALVTHSPGPGGKGSIVSFMSNDTFGRQGAVQALTDQEQAGVLVGKLKAALGKMPAYYQAMLRVKLKGGVATEVGCVMVRGLGGKT